MSSRVATRVPASQTLACKPALRIMPAILSRSGPSPTTHRRTAVVVRVPAAMGYAPYLLIGLVKDLDDVRATGPDYGGDQLQVLRTRYGSDFEGRVRAWRQALAESERLGDEFAERIERQRPQQPSDGPGETSVP